MRVKRRKMRSFVDWLAGNYENILPTLRILFKNCMRPYSLRKKKKLQDLCHIQNLNIDTCVLANKCI